MRLAPLALTVALACGCDDTAPTLDAALPFTCDATSALHARFVVVGEPASSGPIGSQVGGAYHDHPAPRTEATMAEAGGCRYVAARPALCEPACTGSDVCDVDGHCSGYPTTLAAGTLTVTGTTPPITLEPQPGNSYYPQTSYPGLYRPGDELTFALAGAGPVPPLTATVRGVPSLALPTDQLTAIEHQPLRIAWTPITDPAGAEVLVHLDNDHHGLAAYLECTAPASAGELTVPAAILDPLILAGESGIGTYIENAWIEVRHRALVTTPYGCAAVDGYADQFLFVDTVRAPT